MTGTKNSIKFFHSIGFKIMAAYVLLSLINLSFIVSIIFENQTDLISRNTRLESERHLAELIESMKRFSLESGKGSLFRQGTENDNLKRLVDLLSIQPGNSFVFSERGEILARSSEGINPPESYLSDGLRSLTAMTFSGREYYLRINEQQQVMYCYVPLSGFQLGDKILLLEKKLGGMNESLTRLYYQALYVIFVVLFFHTIFALLLYRYIIKPVLVLIDGTESISAGKLDTRIHLPERKDEFARLAHTFNRMAESLHSNVETLSGEISSARETIEKSEKKSTRDELTGLYSRRYFIERIEEENKKTAVTGAANGLMLIRIDNFSEITSIYGPQTRNIIIAEAAKKIKNYLSNFDVAALYSSELFAVLSPGISAQALMETAENIRRAVNESAIITADGNFTITVTILAVCKSEGYRLDPETLEVSMREAHQKGQNRVELV